MATSGPTIFECDSDDATGARIRFSFARASSSHGAPRRSNANVAKRKTARPRNRNDSEYKKIPDQRYPRDLTTRPARAGKHEITREMPMYTLTAVVVIVPLRGSKNKNYLKIHMRDTKIRHEYECWGRIDWMCLPANPERMDTRISSNTGSTAQKVHLWLLQDSIRGPLGE